MSPLKTVSYLLLIVLASAGVSTGMKCYSCFWGTGLPDDGCKSNPTEAQLVETPGTGGYEYCVWATGKVNNVEAGARGGVKSQVARPLGCHSDDTYGPGFTACVCASEGCNKSNNQNDYPSGASTVALGALPAICALAVYTLFVRG